MDHPIFRRAALSLLVATALAANAPVQAAPVVIASIDTGANITGDRASRITGGRDFVNNDDVPEDESDVGHGTIVANVLLDNAPDAQVMPLKVSRNHEFHTTEIGNAAYNYILARPEVRVIDHDYKQPADLGLMQKAVSQGKVIVIQAGNHGHADPEFMAQVVPKLSGGGVIVGGVDGSNDISFSNHAGKLKNFYLVAPLYNGHASFGGTSFAKAWVSATAGEMISRDPHLTPQEVVEILFKTADDLGDPGVDEVYGHGKLNPKKALEPVGESTVGGGSSSAGIAVAAVAVGGAIAYALTKKSKGLKKTLIMDSYGRSFTLDLSQRITARSDLAQTRALLKGYTALQKSVVTANGPERFAYASVSTPNSRDRDDRLLTDPFAEDGERLKDFVYAYHSFDRDGSEYHYALNGTLNGDFGAGREALAGFNFASASMFSTPYLGFANSGMALSYGKPYLDSGLRTRVGISAYDDGGRHGAASDSVLFETQVDRGPATFGIQMGYLLEDGSLFGGSSNGPFSVDSASTLSLGLSASWEISDRLTLVGSYNEGLTSVKENGNGLLSDFSSLRSNARAGGILAKSVFSYQDRLGLAVSQPLGIRQGSVDLDVPVRRDVAGNIYKTHERLDLGTGDNPETRFELFYGRTIGTKTSAYVHFVHKEGDFLEREGRNAALAAFTREF